MAAWRGRGISSRLSLKYILLRNPNPKPNPNNILNPNPRFPLPSQFLSSRGIASKLFVGGLSFYTTEESLSEAFSQYGQVIEAKIVMDRVSDRSKGFGFVTFASQGEADKAVSEMNGKVLNGRTVFVDYAKAKLPRNDDLPIARPPPELLSNK